MRAATFLINIQAQGENVVITSNDDAVKQVFFSWADDGKFMAFYGEDVPSEVFNRTYKWTLTRELCLSLVHSITSSAEEGEDKAYPLVAKTITSFLNGETPVLDEFTKSYIRAAFWTCDSSYFDEDTQQCESTGKELGELYTTENIHPESLKQVQADCLKFQSENKNVLNLAYSMYRSRDGYSGPALAGHDFWFTRNGCGTGFHDRSELTRDGLGERLYKACKSYREIHVSDDADLGVVYFE